MIAILDYGVGNLFSVEKAFHSLGADAVVTSDPAVVRKADKLVLPGVGAFGDCMKNFEASGLKEALKERIESGIPMLGICVGLQILFESSEESPGVPGLGFLKGKVKKIKDTGLKIPHMGWNSLSIIEKQDNALLKNLSKQPYVYFVHSFHAVPEDKDIITSVTDYGEQLTASVAYKNIMAAQFHPEKSGDVGLQILKNFLDY
jgi:glutamine amidotransferase